MPRKPEAKAVLCWFLEGEVLGPVGVAGPNRKSADALVKEMRRLGRIEPVDEASVMVTVMLGAAVDADPTNAALWGQYRASLADLRGVGAGGDDDAIEKLLSELGGADLRDAEEQQPADSRRAGRPGRADVGAAVHGVAAAGRRRRGGAAS